MRTTRLYLPTLAPGEQELAAAETHYLVRVRRLAVDAGVELFDGRGQVADAALTRIQGDRCWLRIGNPRQVQEQVLPLTLAVAPPKGERADWLVEKATELGIERLLWLSSERGVVKPRDAGSRAARWQRLAEAAARQAGRTQMPHIEAQVSLAEVVVEPVAYRWLADPLGEPLGAVLRNLAPASAICLIGPEGGFTPAEVAMAQQAGYRPVQLGPYVLRVETAALAAAASVASAGWTHTA